VFRAIYTIQILCLASLICLSASGAEKYAGEFLSLGVGARPLGMGGSFVAIADDATAAYWNPAGLGGLDRTEITFMHAGIFGLDNYDFINYVQPVGAGAFGLSWIRLGVADIPITELPSSGNMSASNRPYISGRMQNTENAFMISYGKHVHMHNVTMYRGKSVVVSAPDPIPAHVDGEAIDSCPRIEFTMLPDAIKVLIPKNTQQENP